MILLRRTKELDVHFYCPWKLRWLFPLLTSVYIPSDYANRFLEIKTNSLYIFQNLLSEFISLKILSLHNFFVDKMSVNIYLSELYPMNIHLFHLRYRRWFLQSPPLAETLSDLWPWSTTRLYNPKHNKNIQFNGFTCHGCITLLHKHVCGFEADVDVRVHWRMCDNLSTIEQWFFTCRCYSTQLDRLSGAQ